MKIRGIFSTLKVPLTLISLIFFSQISFSKDPVTGSYFLLFGASGGVQRIYPTNDPVSYKRSVDAQILDLKFVSSGYLSRFTLDWAFGLEHVPLFKDALRSPRKSSTGLFGEFSPRFRFGTLGTFQFGPTGKIIVSKDPTFAVNQPSEQFILAQLGPQFVYDIPFQDKYLARIEVLTLVDVNVPLRKLYSIIMGLQIGYLSDTFTDKEFAGERVAEQKRFYLDEVERDVSHPSKNLIKLTLRSDLLRFNAGQSDISKRSKSYLYKVAYFLNTNPKTWKHLDIFGHTDKTILERSQPSLSKNRADAIQSALIEAGVAPYKISTFGKGSTEPLKVSKDGPEIDGSNRRVDLIFRGVSNETFFEEDLKKIRLFKDESEEPSEKDD
jgi:outer membrane protein OmpA-like peptidoglycan-associated protein